MVDHKFVRLECLICWP
uniref:Uncharacterized protein n=1 Tax=Arundo donax TaxID=35708 RepID=A0A0A9DB89_ARUDO